MKINFNLNHKTNSTGKAFILVLISRKGESRIRKSTELFIKPGQWNPDLQRAKKTCPFQTEINNELEEIERKIKGLPALYRAKSKELTFQSLADEIDLILKKEESKDADFFVLATQMRDRLKIVNPEAGTYSNYNSVISLVREYMQLTRQKKMTVNDFTYKWFRGFFEYCLTGRENNKLIAVQDRRRVLKNITEQTYAHKLKIIKTILINAEKQGLLHCFDYKNLEPVKRDNPHANFIYLTEDEIKQLYKYKYKNSIYKQAVDILTFMCVTGMRISDIYRYKVKDENFLYLIAKKTEKEQFIPYSYHPIAVDLIKKYGEQLPKIDPNVFNKTIKEACREAGIDKWGKVSAHTGRRSLATNWFKRKWPIGFIMEITGHTKEDIFLKYIRMEKYEKANYVLEFAKKDFSGEF